MTQTLQQAPPSGPPTPPKATASVADARRPRRRWPHRVIPVVLILLGVLVVLYPVAATYYNNDKQQEFARKYQQQVQATPPTQRAAGLAAAEAYNASLPPTILKDPWDPTNESQTTAYSAYLAQLSGLEAMARVRIPAIKVDLPLYHGTSEQTLSRGVGHLFGSSLPVGGAGTHAVLTGHSALANATMFDHLEDLTVGDHFYVDVLGRTLAYEVDQTKVVLPDQLDDLARVDGQDLVTLVTCTPHGVNSHRLLVRAHRVAYQPSTDPQPQAAAGLDLTVQPWMWARFACAGAALLALLAMVVGWIRGDRRRRARRALPAPARTARTTPGGDERGPQ